MTEVVPIRAAAIPTLPGLELPAARSGPVTQLESEARAHIDALRAAGRLNEGHRLLVALVLDLARTVGIGAVTGKAAGVAMASRQLLDAMAQLPALVDEVSSDEWAQVLAALSGGGAGDDG